MDYITKNKVQISYMDFRGLCVRWASPGSAFRKLQSVGLYTKTEHRTVKYLNNLIEQDHRPIKRRNKFYQSLRTASSTIKGMETLRGIYKKNRRNGTLFGSFCSFSKCIRFFLQLTVRTFRSYCSTLFLTLENQCFFFW